MAKQTMLVNVHEDETRIALVENNVLVGLHVQQTDRERKVGNIYRGRIVKINPAFQAAFVDYGEPRNGFLSISDVNFQLYKPRDNEKGRPKIQHVLREGQSVMVQIIKEGMSNKGSALTTFVSLAGRYMVMSPNSDRSGVSRKIEDPDTRRRLKDTMEALSGGEDLGVIVRTAGIDQPVAELKKDLEGLRKEWKGIQSKYDKTNKPGLLYQEPSPIVRVLRDYFTDGVQEVWVDDAEGFQEALRYFKTTLPKYQKRLKLYVGDKSLFSAYKIEQQIESLDSARVNLKSGGSIIIATTEALVSIDVNSGRSNQAQDIEETALRTNVEAAEEIARQLQLRNLGGLIVIDFIDMMQAKNRKQVEKALADAMKGDKARTTLGTISQFGLLELSRQRIDMELSRGLRVQCPTCGGTGQIPTVNSSANNVLRKLRELAATGRYTEIHGEMPLEAANFLLNDKREALRDLEMEFEIAVKLEADPDLPAGAPVVMHGVTGSRDEEDDEDREEASARSGQREAHTDDDRESTDDESGQRRRRRRRRRRRGSGRDSDGVSVQDDGADREQSGRNLYDEELDVEPVVAEETEEDDEAAPEEDGNGMEELVAGEHHFDAPHAELHAEPGAVERRSRRDASPPPSQPETGGDTGVVFQSQHIITDPEALEKMPPARVRTSPFKAIADRLPPDTVVFDSANLGGTVPLTAEIGGNGAQSEGDADGSEGDGKRKARRSRGRGKGKGSAKPEEAATHADAAEEAQPQPTQATPDVDTDDAADTAEGKEAGSGSRRRSRGRRGGAKKAAQGEQAPSQAAEQSGSKGGRRKATGGRGRGGKSKEEAKPSKPALPLDEHGDPDGNRIVPKAQTEGARPGARRSRSRRGRGRGQDGGAQPSAGQAD